MIRALVVSRKRSSLTWISIGTFSGVIFGAGAAFGITLFLGNTLGEAGTGAFFQILAFFSIASIACTFGSDTGLVRTISAQVKLGDKSDLKRTLEVAFVPVCLFSTIVAVLLWNLAIPLSELFGGEQSRDLIRLLAVFVIPGSLINVVFGGIRGFGRIGTFTALQNVLLPCLRFTSVAAIVFLGLGTLALAAAWIVPIVLVLAIAVVLLLSRFRIVRRTEPYQEGRKVETSESRLQSYKKFWSFSAGRGASSLVEIILEWIDVILVGAFLGPAAAGIYGVVNRCVRLGQMADHSARIVVGPLLGAAMATSDQKQIQRIYLMSTKILILVAWPFYLTLMVNGKTLLAFFGSGFEAGFPALVIISFAMCIATTAGGVQSVLLMAGRSKWQLYNKLLALSVAITGNLMLIPHLGLVGAAITWACAVLIDCGLATWEVHSLMKFRVSIRSLLLPIILALFFYGIFQGFSRAFLGSFWISVLISLIFLSAFYLTLIWILRKRLGLK